MLVASRRVWWGLPLLLVLLACLGALVAQLPSPLPQAPVLTSVSLPVVRFVRDVAAALTVGCVVVGGLVAPGGCPQALRWSTRWACVWGAALVAQAVLTVSDILAIGVIESLDAWTLWSFLSSVLIGQVLLWQGVAVLLVLLLGRAVISAPTAWVVASVAVAGAALPALLGHGALTDGHVAATVSLALHLAAVSLWLGGLTVVVALMRVDSAHAITTLPRFSAVALACVLLVAESGLLNASLRLASPSLLLGSDYGGLLLMKASLLLWLVLLGWRQRSRVLPDLRAGAPTAPALLARVAAWEFLAMGAAIAVGVAMSRIGLAEGSVSSYLVNPLCVAGLAAALPGIASRAFRPAPGRRWVVVVRRYPEVAAVLLAVVVIEVAGVGLPALLLGPDLGSIVAVVLLASAGWVMCVALQSSRQVSARVAAMSAWTVAVGVVYAFELARSAGPAEARLWLLALALALVCVVVASPTSAAPAAGPAPSPVEASRG